MTSAEYPPTTQGNLLQISHAILEAEWGISASLHSANKVVWNANPAFYRIGGLGITASLTSESRDDFSVIKADLLMDEGETTLQVDRNDRSTFDEDVYALDFLNTFRNAFFSHNHQICIDSKPVMPGTPLSWRKKET